MSSNETGTKTDYQMKWVLWSSIFVTLVAKNIGFPFMTLSVPHKVYDIR